MSTSDDDTERIVTWAEQHHEILQVWLYGSRARGDHRADSDIDLAIVVKGGCPSDRQDCWMFAPWRSELRLSNPVHLELYDVDVSSSRVGPAVCAYGKLLYSQS